MALIVNSVDYEHMGAVNGLGQSLVAFLRAIGPYFGAMVLAWSFENGLPFPLNRYFIFCIMSLLCVINFVMTIGLPEELNRPKAELKGNAPVLVE
jgi:hypothetical protein